MTQAKKGSRVKIHYTLSTKGGGVIESNVGQVPLELTLGKGKAIKGLENGVLGMSAGQTKTVTVKPAEGYGPKDPALVSMVALSDLPPGTAAEPGTEVSFENADGTAVEGRIVKVEDGRVTVDGNHPLAGRNLTFEIRLVAVG